MVILCASLFFVYLIFFDVHGEQLKEDIAYLRNTKSDTYPQVAALDHERNDFATASFNNNQQTKKEIGSFLPAVSQDEIERVLDGVSQFDEPGKKFHSVQVLFGVDVDALQESSSGVGSAGVSSQVDKTVTTVQTPQDSDIYMLRDTWHWRGDRPVAQAGMKSLDYLAISDDGEYILKNMDNTHFVKMTHIPQDLWSNVQKLGGNIVAFEDKNSIDSARLFGDKVQKISVPSYDGIKIFLLVYFAEKDHVWFLQVDDEIFQQRKASLSETFGEWYSW